MSSKEVIIPILTLVLGWFLSTFTRLFETRRENRKALSKAIADMLEIRHRLLGERCVMEILRSMAKLSSDDEKQLRAIFVKILPNSDELAKRFDETVTLIASVDPMLGFRLRSKDIILKTGALITAVEAQGGPCPQATEFEQRLSDAAIPHLHEMLLALARRHSFFTLLRIKRLLNQPVTPDGLEEIIRPLKVALVQAQNAEATAVSPKASQEPAPQPATASVA